jgi:hypothetical protein
MITAADDVRDITNDNVAVLIANGLLFNLSNAENAHVVARRAHRSKATCQAKRADVGEDEVTK